MSALAVFCLGTVVFLVPRDLFFVETRDVEVWLGFEVRGVVALLTVPATERRALVEVLGTSRDAIGQARLYRKIGGLHWEAGARAAATDVLRRAFD